MARKRHIRVYFPKLLFLATYLLCTPASAETREFTYEVYAGGLHAVQAKLHFDIQDQTYSATVDAETRGWLASLVPWSGKFHTDGTMDDPHSFSPTKHTSISSWRGSDDIKTFLYKDNKLLSIEIEEENKAKETPEIDPTLTADTTDILSATLSVMDHTIQSGECNGASDIYDGKRRFTMSFKDKGQKILDKSRYNIFSGPSRLCEIEIAPKGGHWHKKPRGWLLIQEQGRQKGALPTVWMAKVSGFDYAIPVKIQVKTDYGTLLMHLTNVK